MAAEAPSPSPPPSPPHPPLSSPPRDPSSPPSEEAFQHWCYHCEKHVPVETQAGQPDDVICSECKFGFVESIPTTYSSSAAAASILSPPSDHIGISNEPTLGNQFIQVLRLLAQVARVDESPISPPLPQPRLLNPAEGNNHDVNNEYDDDGDQDDDEDDDDDDLRSVEIEGQSDDEVEEREEDIRRRRRDVLPLRLRDFANRARSEGRNRILDWAEILMGLEDNSVEFRFELPETTDRYIGNPRDYVDAAEYEALLQNLADAEGRRGAPPAAKSAVENLKVVEIKSVDDSYVCAICKDGVSVGDVVKEMPCGHGYHGDCIVPWLAARNSCPVCRFELPTDDADYEEERKKRFPGSSSGSSAGNSV